MRPAGERLQTVDFTDDPIRPPKLRFAIADDDLLGDDAGLLSGGDDLSGESLLESDPLSLADDPLSLSEPPQRDRKSKQRFHPDSMLPFGGWYRDDLRMAISYRAGGHADPVLQAIVEIATTLPNGDQTRRQLLQSHAVAACVACHPAAESGVVNWRSEPLIGRSSAFTKFAHKPHLNVSQLGDCAHCHRIASSPMRENKVNLASLRGHGHGSEFEPLTRASCAACHQPHAAGDSCVTCHRYHIKK